MESIAYLTKPISLTILCSYLQLQLRIINHDIFDDKETYLSNNIHLLCSLDKMLFCTMNGRLAILIIT